MPKLQPPTIQTLDSTGFVTSKRFKEVLQESVWLCCVLAKRVGGFTKPAQLVFIAKVVFMKILGESKNIYIHILIS